MSIKIVTQPEEFVNVESIEVIEVRDFFDEKKIIASIKGVNRDIVLWEGLEEYTKAGNWTNDSIVSKIIDVLDSGSIRWH